MPTTGWLACALLTLCRPPFENSRDTDAVAVLGAMCGSGGGERGRNCRRGGAGGGGGFGAAAERVRYIYHA
jgi:hypothetical protein